MTANMAPGSWRGLSRPASLRIRRAPVRRQTSLQTPAYSTVPPSGRFSMESRRHPSPNSAAACMGMPAFRWEANQNGLGRSKCSRRFRAKTKG